MSILAFLLLMLMGGVELAAQPTAAAPSAQKKTDAAQAESNPMVCQVHQVLGSLIKRRKVCLHKSEWDWQHFEEQQMINRTQVLRGITPGG